MSTEDQTIVENTAIANPSLISPEGVEAMQKKLMDSEQVVPQTVEQVQAKLVQSEAVEVQNPEKTAIEEQRAALQQRAAMEQQQAMAAKKGEIAGLVQERAKVGQALQQSPSSPLPTVATSTIAFLGAGKLAQVFGDAKGKAIDAVQKAAEENADIGKIAKNFGLNDGADLTAAANHLKAYGAKDGLMKEVNKALDNALQNVDGLDATSLPIETKGQLADLAQKGHKKLAEQVSKILPENIKEAGEGVVESIKASVADMSKKHKNVLDTDIIQGLEKNIGEGMQSNPFTGTANNIVKFHRNVSDKLHIDPKLLLAVEAGVVVLGSLAAHHVLTAGEREERKKNEEIYGKYTGKIAAEQKELMELAGAGNERGGR